MRLDWVLSGVTILLRKEAAYLGASPVRHQFEIRYKARHFLLPIVQSGGRRDNQERAPDSILLSDVAQNGNRLNCFTQTHLISQNSVDSLKEKHAINKNKIIT